MQETEVYYLRNRYYSPSVSRFISSDLIISCNETLIEQNLYTYCINDPILLSDPDGLFWIMGAYASHWGFYHRRAQLKLKQMYGTAIEIEKTIDGTHYRADAILNNEVYEVKPYYPKYLEIGTKQVEKYVDASNGTLRKGETQLNLGGEFLVHETSNTLVYMTLYQSGCVIQYNLRVVRKKTKTQTSKVTSAVHATSPSYHGAVSASHGYNTCSASNVCTALIAVSGSAACTYALYKLATGGYNQMNQQIAFAN